MFIIFLDIPILSLILRPQIVHAEFNTVTDLQYSNLKIESNPKGMCTTHIKTFSEHPYTQDVYSKLIQDNIDNQIWTLWSSHNDSNHVTPILQFYEICSINIIIEAPTPEPEHVRLLQYSKNILYIYREWTHSLLIFVRLSCSKRYHNSILKYPHRLYLHFVDCLQYLQQGANKE